MRWWPFKKRDKVAETIEALRKTTMTIDGVVVDGCDMLLIGWDDDEDLNTPRTAEELYERLRAYAAKKKAEAPHAP